MKHQQQRCRAAMIGELDVESAKSPESIFDFANTQRESKALVPFQTTEAISGCVLDWLTAFERSA
ncbi:hypothetical protein O9992_15360 [Vibrio lentus]|nr:hypothetical protein [Vibrio lentus]